MVAAFARSFDAFDKLTVQGSRSRVRAAAPLIGR
jgi:hypothetical protein